jgi:Ca-activated chloride channel family protein
MDYPVSALVLAAVCGIAPAAAAQPKPTTAYVSVVDGKGDPVTGLSAEDFRVREDGVAREVLKVGPATEPLTVALLVDDSQASQRATQMIREAVNDFITALSGKADISIVTFGERPTIAVDYTSDQKKLHDGANRIFPRAGAGAYLMEAIIEVSRGLQKREATRPVIAVLAIDDETEFSNQHYDQVLNALNKGGAVLHVIALGPPGTAAGDERRNREQTIALGTERTGGRRDNVLAFTAAALKMTQLASELLQQYEVSYARPETLIPPEKIDITVTRPGLTARARTRTREVGAR